MSDESTDVVFVALVEVAPLAGCQLDPADFGGAFVRCYVMAETETDAMERIEVALEEDRFGLIDVEWCVDAASVEWETPDEPTATAMIFEARTSNAVIFGEFHTWPPE